MTPKAASEPDQLSEAREAVRQHAILSGQLKLQVQLALFNMDHGEAEQYLRAFVAAAEHVLKVREIAARTHTKSSWADPS